MTVENKPDTQSASKEKTAEELLTEYKQVAAVAGDRSYRIQMLKLELDSLYKQMYEINAQHIKAVNPPATPKLVPDSQVPA